MFTYTDKIVKQIRLLDNVWQDRKQNSLGKSSVIYMSDGIKGGSAF